LRIVIPTTGSRGDVQPYLALGQGLRAAGYDVRLATHADFEALVRDHGLDFFAIEANGRALQASEVGDRMLRAGSNPFAFMREFVRLRVPLLRELMSHCREACVGADAVLLSPTALLIGQSVAEALRLPTVWTSLQPTSPSRFQANFLFPAAPAWLPDGGLYNLATHLVAGETVWQLVRTPFNEARREVLGLPALPLWGPAGGFFNSTLKLYGYSPRVVPRPPDWGPQHQVTGYWFLDEAGVMPPPGLEAFLEAGPAPVYVGFGSMHNRNVEEITELVLRALERTGQRGVLHTGWGGLEPTARSDQVFWVGSVSHHWLFPRLAAVVHHGGAGTTGAALRAGVPAVVVPFMSDQPFWGRRVFELGVGPRPIPRRQLSAERLAHAIEVAVSNQDLRKRAAALGALIRSEQGVTRAVELIQGQLPLRPLVHPRARLALAGSALVAERANPLHAR